MPKRRRGAATSSTQRRRRQAQLKSQTTTVWPPPCVPGQLTHLGNLPAELLELIITHLQFRDLANLRLTKNIIATKISRAFFWKKKLYVTDAKALREFVDVTKEEWLVRGGEIRDLVVAAEAGCKIPPKGGEVAFRRRLGVAFENLKVRSSWKRLDSFTLTIEGTALGLLPFPKKDTMRWREIWALAAWMFEVVMRALNTSRISVRRVDVFGDVPRCSLAFNRFAAGIEGLEFRHLEELAISLSEESNLDTKAVSRFLQQSPSIRCLKLRWFKTRTQHPDSEKQLFFKNLIRGSEGFNFASLRDCTLTGLVHLEASDLVSFMGGVQLERLSVSDTNLQDGGWQQVFDQIVVTQENLEFLSLQNLYEETLVCFDEPG